MVEIPVYDLGGKSEGTISVAPEVFGQKENKHVVHSTLTWYLATKRRGGASTKTRGEVRGGGTKPWRQKGTGRARAGSIRSPLWRGGGVIFGPKPRDYSYNLPKKVRKLALKVVLSDKVKAGKVKVVPEVKLSEPKTKEIAKILKNLKVEGKGLIVTQGIDDKVIKAGRNLRGIKLVHEKDINIHDLLAAEWLLLTKGAVKSLEERLSA